MKRDEILWNCDHHSVEPVTMSKYVAEKKQMRKWMVEFLNKFQGRGIKIHRDNLIRVAKSIIFFNILRAIAPWVTSSWAIVFFALSLRLLPLVYIFGSTVCIIEAVLNANLTKILSLSNLRIILFYKRNMYNHIIVVTVVAEGPINTWHWLIVVAITENTLSHQRILLSLLSLNNSQILLDLKLSINYSFYTKK